MFYRRKLVLALLQLLDNQTEKIRLQKLLFLYSQRKLRKPEYDFIPYKFGCYSYSLNADLNAMLRKDVLTESQRTVCFDSSKNYFKLLKKKDQDLLRSVVIDYGSMSNTSLIRHTYINFPYYAINSTIADEILTEEQQSRVTSSLTRETDTILFTIGYEGISLEHYLNKLIKNNISVLVDVRRNPLSMKFGFSKTLLKKYCNSVDVEYVHIPEVGIQSNLRQELNTQADYDNLFVEYKKTTLKSETLAQKKIVELLKDKKRIALTCFEADVCQCHRKHLAESITNMPEFDYSLQHI